jgi:two-component system, cell cycle response regulator DivK
MGSSMTNGKPLILVVDDYEDNRTLYTTYLASCGFAVEQAADGLQAVEKGRALLPHAIVMDLALPGIDGWEATRQLKADPVTRGIPVIALTGHSLQTHEARAKEVQCDAFLTKPCVPEDLVAKIRELIAAR